MNANEGSRHRVLPLRPRRKRWLGRWRGRVGAAEVRQLSWSNPTIASLLQAATTAKLENVSTPAPSFCADARAWAQNGYRALSAASREFEASQAARRSSDLEEGRSLETLLKPYENASDRALIRKTNAVENKLLASSDF